MARPGLKVFLRDATILFFGVFAATGILDGIQVDSWTTLVLVAVVLAVLNVFLKPILVLFTLPFVIFTFGFGLLLINAILLYLAGQVVPGFLVPDFWTALWGAIFISLINLVVNIALTPRVKMNVNWSGSSTNQRSRNRRAVRDDDIIDV